MKKFLIISFNYEPLNNPRAIRWYSILSYLKKKKINLSIDFITYKKKKTSISKNITIHSINNTNNFKNKGKLYHFFYKFFEKIIFLIGRVIKIFGKYFIWPDYAFFTILPMYIKCVYLINQKKITHIISSSNPFSSHVVGYLLKKKFPKIIWIIDSGDPFCLMKEPKINNLFLYDRINYLFEKKITKLCYKFYVNNHEQKKQYIDCFPEFKKKFFISKSLILKRDTTFRSSKLDKKVLSFIYAGSFYENIRNPIFFLDSIDQIIQKFDIYTVNIKIYIYTNSNLFHKSLNEYSHLKKHFIISDLKDFKKLKNINDKCDFHINIGNRDNLHTPSKLYEFIGNNYKIINFHHNQETNTINILKHYNNYINVNLDKQLDEKKVVKFLMQPKIKKFSSKFLKKYYNENYLETITKQYFFEKF